MFLFFTCELRKDSLGVSCRGKCLRHRDVLGEGYICQGRGGTGRVVRLATTTVGSILWQMGVMLHIGGYAQPLVAGE
jgi:hypothetical protein